MADGKCPGIAPPEFYDADLCPVRSVLAQVGDKWSLLVFIHLRFGSHRFSELLGALPDISQRMLTKTLRKLEREGFVDRTVTPTIPPRVDYALTDLGHSLTAPLTQLSNWASEHREDVEAARKRFDRRTQRRAAKRSK